MSKLDLSILSVLTVRPVKKKYGRGNYAKHLPSRKGKGLWIKDAFDLVIAKPGCRYAIEVESNAENQEMAKRKVCNGCVFLEWNEERRYHCTDGI